VVIGAGDRQCEVLGAGATLDCPMVSWGTTANVSVPVDQRPDPLPIGTVVSRGALGGWVIEGGLSAAGSFLSWFSEITGRPVEELCDLAQRSPPGARGVVAVSWLDGARAPWWRDDARAGFIGLASAHQVGDLARAVVESVAWEVVRCLALVTDERNGGRSPVGVTLGGAGARIPLWVSILTGVSGLTAIQRRSGEAASAGAALLGARATGRSLNLAHLDPVDKEITALPEVVDQYRALGARTEMIAKHLVELSTPGAQ
jgi:sugar (pentulose or hexulose) kinase